jgi:hypothetical protein
MKLKPPQSPPPDILHVALSTLAAVAAVSLRHSPPDDLFVRDKTFFAAVAGVERSLQSLTWIGVRPGSSIKLFPVISGSIAVIACLLQLRCNDVTIALLPPSPEAEMQAKSQTRAYRLLHARCVEGLVGVSQSVSGSEEVSTLLKSDAKGGGGSLEDEGLAMAMCCAYYSAVAEAAAAAAAVGRGVAAVCDVVRGGDDDDNDDDDEDNEYDDDDDDADDRDGNDDSASDDAKLLDFSSVVHV